MANSKFQQHFVEMVALGRRFQLGNFYDYRTDTQVGGPNTLYWQRAIIEETTETDKSGFEFVVECPYSESTKWDNMNLDDHTRASVLSGLIDKYKGASNYVDDVTSPLNKATQTLVCRVKTRKDMLDIDKLITGNAEYLPNNSGANKKGKAAVTHVVVGIVYGVEAYCVLTQDLDDKKKKTGRQSRNVLDDDDEEEEEEDEDGENEDDDIEEKRKVEDALREVAEKMQTGLENYRPVNQFKEEFDKSELRELTRAEYRLYSDASSQSFRKCNAFDAYKECLAMAQLVRFQEADERKARLKEVVLKVILCPLEVITEASNSAEYLHHDVDSGLLDRCVKLYTSLDQVIAEAEALMRNTLKNCNGKPSLSRFLGTVGKYRELLRNSLKEAVATARKEEDDEQVEKVIGIAEEQTLFKPSRLRQWLKYKQAEAKWTEKVTKKFGFPVVKMKQLTDELSDSFENTYALVLSIPPPEKKTNSVLSDMKQYVSSYKKLVQSKRDRDEESDEESDSDTENENNRPWPMVELKQKQVLAKIDQLAAFKRRNKHLSESVRFVVASDDSASNAKCYYSVYETDRKLNTIAMSNPPGPPTGLKVNTTLLRGQKSKEASIVVRWDYHQDPGYPCHFVIEYRKKGGMDSKWVQQRTTKPGETSATLSAKVKRADLPFEVRVAADTCVGRSEFTDVVDVTEILDSSDDCENISENDSNAFDDEQSCSHSEASEDVAEWKSEASNLPANTEAQHHQQKQPSINTYSSGRVHISEPVMHLNPTAASAIKETSRFAEVIRSQCQRIGNRNDMDLYGVPLRETQSSIQSGRRLTLDCAAFDGHNGYASRQSGQRRTLLVMGATGAGKTTLINGMINYIFDVQWEDPFRFQLIQETLVGQSQANSQTSQITAYDINYCDGFRIPYSLTIVDTPGYGDTKGLARDEEITQMIRQFFEDKNGIQEVDVVGFVAQASLPRLTATQMYIFDSVLQIFGKDIQENINFLLTFADSQTPPVLSAIAEARLPSPTDQLGQPVHHRFNNSGFFCSSRQSSAGVVSTVDKFNNFFWKMGMKSFQNFFNVLATMTTRSLSLTREVLRERKELEVTVEGLQPLIKFGLAKIEELRKTEAMFASHKAQIEANENVEFEVEVSKPKKVDNPPGQHLTNCNKCYVTCHNPCAYANDNDKVNCTAMDHDKPEPNRPCRICPLKCIWNIHSNQPYRWEYVTEKTFITADDVKDKYEKALNKKLSTEQLIDALKRDIKENEADVLEMVTTVAKCIERLGEIALRPDPFSTPQYIDLIIDAELQDKKPGFQQRIESLKKLRQTAVIMTKIKNKEPLLSLDRKDDLNDGESVDGRGPATRLQRVGDDDDRN